MKIELCAKKREWTEPCPNQKFCCGLFKQLYNQHHIEFDDKGLVTINLKDYQEMWQYYHNHYHEPIPYMNAVHIQYCPFCGEKIE